MLQNSQNFVLKQPFWKRWGLVFMSALFVIGGFFIISTGNYIPGIICVAFFGVAVVELLKSSTVLIADSEGIIPTFALPRNSTKKIPWAMIERIGVATQKIRRVSMRIPTTSQHKFIAIYLRDKEFLTSEKPIFSAISQAAMHIMRQTGLSDLDDDGAAQLYVPWAVLPGWSVEKIVEQLNAMRPTPVSAPRR